ncbi:hypothetical protein G6F70_009177 [Rhizopus microsporus]|nr:hypothetical protein G6F71_009177 [Rhizopus microsporus]KAG1192695.1 hypothetical protein G6F70_009177 [Rhizopus microsporus]KAG1205982.1 hypothetical protein G6F69_009154 [Rhizopus microsporus]KAG1233951.1 hypothetical protein G6F67_003910 [Rhizopus microsporus]KAG1257245.1 hypothetical protein G6F68_009404 [Rhizopus microsporus]
MSVILLSSDNEEFEVEKEVAQRSVLIKNMLEDIGDSDAPIPLPNVNAKVLAKVIEWCTHHRDDPMTQDDQERRTTDIDEWDQKYMEAANYLDIKPLLEVGCKTVANMIKGKTAEEIRKTFNITNDFTPEEEAQIKKENEWAEDR